MRILLLSHGYPPTLSGVTIVVRKLARAYARRGHEVAVLTARSVRGANPAKDGRVQLLRAPSFPNLAWSEGPIPYIRRDTLREHLAAFRPDIIHTHENFILALQLLRLRQEVSVPLVASCHSLPDFTGEILPWVARLDRPVVAFLWRFLVRLLNRFDHNVFATETHLRLYREHGLRAPATLISNGVDSERYRPPATGDKDSVVEKYGLPEGRRILAVGRLARDKNLEVLIRAMPEVWARTRSHLLLVGRGDHRDELEELVAELALGRCVHFLGYVPERDLPAIYRASDLFAIAAAVEVQSIPVLQALVTGLPVVAADAAALPELVHPGENGYLAPVDNWEAVSRAMIDILENAERRRAFGERSLLIGREHEETHTFRAHEALYERLVAANASGGAAVRMPT